MPLNPIDKEQLRERLDILDVIGGYVRLQRAGTEYRGLCPFHDEKTPSFYVNPARGVWICRGQCGTGGDVFAFVMRAEKLEFREAGELLANRIGATLKTDERDLHRSAERDLIYNVNGLATRLFERALWQTETGSQAREYLLRRGLTEETIRQFRLGYAPDGWDHLARHLERQSVSLDDAERAGLIRRRERSEGYYDRFRHRVMFPILDSQDRTLGFGGRVLRADDEPKYLNTTETAVFHKGTVLYGLPFAVSALKDGAVVVEGYMDVIALHQHGITSAMATLGTALTPDHLRLLRRHTQRIVLCYDADSAGRKATDRAAVMFIEEGVDGRVLTLPAGQDPDQFVGAQGREAFLELLAQAPDLVEHRIRVALEHGGEDPMSRAQAIREAVVPILADIREPLRQTLTLRRVVDWWSGQRVGLQEEFERALSQAVKDHRRQQQRSAESRARRRGDGESAASRSDRVMPERLPREVQVEQRVLAALIHHEAVRARGQSELGAALFTDPTCGRLYAAMLQHGPDAVGPLSDSLDQAGQTLLADLSCRPPEDADEVTGNFDRWVAELRVNALQHQAGVLRQERAALTPEDFEAQAELLRRIHHLERELDTAKRRLLG